MSNDDANRSVGLRCAIRAKRARRIIDRAYGIRPGEKNRRPVRYELLRDSVALVVVTRTKSALAEIKLARALPDGRVVRMHKESRRGFESVNEQIAYFDHLYKKYGNPL